MIQSLAELLRLRLGDPVSSTSAASVAEQVLVVWAT